MTLKQGDVFRMHPDCGDTSTYIVLRVNEGSAAVRCQNQQHIVIPNDVGGTKADFWKAGRPFHISRNASVVLAPGSQASRSISEGPRSAVSSGRRS